VAAYVIPNHSLNFENFSFDTTGIDEDEWDTIVANGGWEKTDDKKGATIGVYGGYTGDTNTPDTEGLYSGTVETISSSYTNMESAWYREHSKLILTGTFLGTLLGTIRDIETANRYGFANLADSEAVIDEQDSGTYYPIGKLRIKWPQGTAQPFDRLYPAASITMASDYTSILTHLIAGKFIYRRFASTDIDSTSFGKSSQIGAFSNFIGTVLAKEDKVIPHIDDIVNSTQAMFSVNNNNKFEYLAYGPVEIVGQLGEILQKDVLESSSTNRKEDAYNAFEVHYKYDVDSDAYGTVVTGTLDNWSEDEERLLKIESKWMHNDNEAVIFKDQVKSRYAKTSPVILVTTGLNKSEFQIGTLIAVTDVNSGLSAKPLQVRKYTKDFPNAKNIMFEMLDAEALYYGKGWAFWGTEASNDPTPVIVPTAVTTSSRSGFADGGDLVANINSDIYGDNFKWW